MRLGYYGMPLACVLALLVGPALRADESDGKVHLGGLKSKAPAGWEAVSTTSKNRPFQWRVNGGQGKDSDAEVTVFYFGLNGAGSADENVARWKSLFIPPKGKTIDDVAKVDKIRLGDDVSVYVDISGTYRFRPRPQAPDSEIQLKPDYRLLEGILLTSRGPYYLRIIGPAKTVGDHKADFDEWLMGFK